MLLDRGTHLLHVTDHGGCAGPTFVLIHGGGDSSATWDPVVPELQRHGRVITYDLVGHGNSTIPTKFRKRMHDDDIDAVVAWAGGPSPVLIGHSLGSAVAMWAAHRGTNPRAVLLVDGVPARRHFEGYPLQTEDQARADLAARGFAEPHLSLFVQMATTDHDQIVEWTNPDVWLHPTVPTIALAASRGPSADARGLIETHLAAHPRPNLEIRWIDAGHSLHHERTDALLEAVRDLLDRT
jgi:pimeloyl-ACP methyl ester carboxylesterase